MQTPTISASFTQSALLENEVYLTDKLENGTRERMPSAVHRLRASLQHVDPGIV